MAEPRRITVVSGVAMNLEKNKNKMPQTIRVSIPLTESTDETYPEFSYVELCKSITEKQHMPLDQDDPFAAQDKAEHDQMLAIAKNFESKYGSQPGKRKHKSFIEDFVDLGEGYEENSFIDNSEAYDELVPSTLTTKFGGFYINVGELDFVSMEDTSADEQLLRKKVKKRKAIESDNEENEVSEKNKKAVKSNENGSEESMKKKRKKLNTDDVKRRKGPLGRVLKGDKSKTVAEILNQVNHASVTTAIKIQAEPAQNPTLSPVRKTLNTSLDKSITSPTVAHNLSLSFPIVDPNEIVAEREAASLSKIEINLSKIESSIDAVILQSREDMNLEDKVAEAPQALPESLPVDVVKALDRVKELAVTGKLSADDSSSGLRFTPEVQQLLLEIYDHIQNVPFTERSAVFNHLAVFFPCGKEALIKRIKKLDLTQHDDKLKQPIAKLKEAIQAVMPSLIEKHRVEVSVKEKLRMDQLLEMKEKKETKDGVTQSDSDDEDENRDTSEKQRRIVAPRKKFQWNEDIRKYLCKVVDIKMEHFAMAKIRSQTPEEYLKSFLEAEIRPLWPTGWIQTRMLFKESRSSHFQWTSNQPKAKKNSLATPKTSTPIVNTPVETTPEHGLCHQTGNIVSFATPVTLPIVRSGIRQLPEELPSVNCLLDSPLNSDIPGSINANGVTGEMPADTSFTAINPRGGSVYEKELCRNDMSVLENELSLVSASQKIKKNDLLLTRSSVFKGSRGDGAGITETCKSRTENTPSDGLDMSVLISAKTDVESGTAVPVSCGSLDRSALKVFQTPGSSPSASTFLNEYMHFSSKKGPGTDEVRPMDMQHGGCQKIEDDDHAPVSMPISGTLFVHPQERAPRSTQVVQPVSGKISSDSSILPEHGHVSITHQTPGNLYTEVRPLLRQSSREANLSPHQLSGPFQWSPGTVTDAHTAVVPPNNYKKPELLPNPPRNDASVAQLPNIPSTSSRLVQKARNINVSPTSSFSLSVSQNLTASPSGSITSKWTSKSAAQNLTPEDKGKSNIIPFSTSVSNSHAVATVSFTQTLPSSGSHDLSPSSKGFSSTVRQNVFIDEVVENLRSAGFRSNTELELALKEVFKGNLRPALMKPGSQVEEAKKVMTTKGSGSASQFIKDFFSQDSSKLIQLQQQNIQQQQTSHPAAQGSRKLSTEATSSDTQSFQLFPSLPACEISKQLVQERNTTNIQSTRHLADQAVRSTSASSVFHSNSYRLCHTLQVASLDGPKYASPSLPCNSVGASASSQSQQLSGLHSNTVGLRNTAPTQGQSPSSAYSMPYKADSQSSQHRYQ